MYDAITLYDDLVAIRRTAQVMHEELPQDVRDGLQEILTRIEGKLRAALKELPEDDLEWVIEGLDEVYNNEARGELDVLVRR